MSTWPGSGKPGKTDLNRRVQANARTDASTELAKSSGDSRPTVEDLALFELLNGIDPQVRAAFQDFLNLTIFAERPLALDLKTRFLVLVGITTAVRGDREGIEWSAELAMKHGATEAEVLEAMSLANLPAGTPAIEYAAKVWQDIKAGRARVRAPRSSTGGAPTPWPNWRR